MDLQNVLVAAEAFDGGLWVPAPELGPEVAWRVRSLDTPEYRRVYDELVQALPLEKRITGLDAADQERIEAECFIRAVLTDWRGWTDGGVPLPYSEAQARIFVTDPRYIRIRRSAYGAARTVEVRGRVSLEADAKN